MQNAKTSRYSPTPNLCLWKLLLWVVLSYTASNIHWQNVSRTLTTTLQRRFLRLGSDVRRKCPSATRAWPRCTPPETRTCRLTAGSGSAVAWPAWTCWWVHPRRRSSWWWPCRTGSRTSGTECCPRPRPLEGLPGDSLRSKATVHQSRPPGWSESFGREAFRNAVNCEK